MKHSKGNTMAIVVLLVLALAFTGCGYKITKKTPEPVVEEKVAEEKPADKARVSRVVLGEILSKGEKIDTDVYSRIWIIPQKDGTYKEVEYTWERWVIRSNDGVDFHAVIFEYGRLQKIEPVESLEDARGKFRPYGGWNH